MLAASVRWLVHNPGHILKPYLSTGMTAMDTGCGMGFFTVPMANMVGTEGRVIAVDIQPKMLSGMVRYAGKKGVEDRIEPHLCGSDSLRIENRTGTVDFILVFMLHEAPDRERMIRELHIALKPDGKLLFAEPIIHVGKKTFDRELSEIKDAGFRVLAAPKISICRAALLEKS